VRIFAVVNQKGGCGKTTTAINLAGVFASRGYRTLLVDMDPQGHCAAGLAIPEQRVDLHIGDAMLAADEAPVDLQRLLWRVSRNLDLAPSTVRLAALEAPRGELASRPDAHARLGRVLERLKGAYDLCLIDCSPAIGLLAFNALVAADEVIIPVETGFFSLQGASKQVNAIKSIGKRLGVQPSHRLLATMHDEKSVLSQDLLDEMRRRFGTKVLPVVIRLDQALKEAASFGQPAVEYAPDSAGAKDYAALADHLVATSLAGKADSIDDDAPVEPARSVLTSARLPRMSQTPDSETARAALEDARGRTMIIEVEPPPAEGAAANPAPSSRAADIASRARRLQTAAMVASAPIVEAAPLPPASSSAGPVASPRPISVPALQAPAFGVTTLGRTATFRQPASIGRDVSVAGDFNQWSPERTRLTLDPVSGVFEASVDLPAGGGVVQYRLVVDGRWMPDPFNPATSPNPFGGVNSVVPASHR
jgi:chromosome partitioning protein